MSGTNAVTPEEVAERRRRARRAAILLGIVAGSFYLGFILLTFFRGAH